jgi:signal transduction histidine kinase
MDILRISPLPIVDLSDITCPHSGLTLQSAAFCVKQFSIGDQCRRHYESLADSKATDFTPCQCPFGFTSFPVQVGTRRFAITGVIPFPRSGGSLERQMAKSYPSLKFSKDRLVDIRTMLQEANNRYEELAATVVSQQTMSLHEIRKLNRTIKQNAERICKRDSPQDPDLANSELVAIWKAAELMSNQFDVLELLANEELATLPRKTPSEPYRVFHKLIRIFRHGGAYRHINLKSPPAFYPQVVVCDKTFPILASVLLENAIKYSTESSSIDVTVTPSPARQGKVRIQIENIASDTPSLGQRIFEKGFRAATDVEGTGKGLYLAQLVARQHNSILHFSKDPSGYGGSLVKCRFWFDLDIYLA